MEGKEQTRTYIFPDAVWEGIELLAVLAESNTESIVDDENDILW